MPRGILAYNPAAGRFPSRILAERAAAVLRGSGWDIHLEQTENSEHIVKMAQESAKLGLEAFFIVGGDGSLNQACRGLIGTDVALGVLPAGTANVWAQELGLPGLTWTRWMALEESARRLAKGQIRTIDLGLCNGNPFLLWGGIGLDAFIVHRIEPRTRWEKHFSVVHYTASAAWHASFWRGMNLEVEVEGQQINGHFLLALVSNVHLYAGGMAEISPNARLDDGRMDLWLFQGETLGDTVQVAWELLNGQHITSDRAQRLTVEKLHLKSESPMFVQVDGEPLDIDADVTIEVQPKALKVLVPESTPHPLFARQ